MRIILVAHTIDYTWIVHFTLQQHFQHCQLCIAITQTLGIYFCSKKAEIVNNQNTLLDTHVTPGSSASALVAMETVGF